MANEVIIDLDNLKDDNDHFSEREVRVIEKATGKELWQLTGKAQPTPGAEFTEEQVANMSDSEYAAKRENIMQAMRQNKISSGSPDKNVHSFSAEQIAAMSDSEYEKERENILAAMGNGNVQ